MLRRIFWKIGDKNTIDQTKISKKFTQKLVMKSLS